MVRGYRQEKGGGGGEVVAAAEYDGRKKEKGDKQVGRGQVLRRSAEECGAWSEMIRWLTTGERGRRPRGQGRAVGVCTNGKRGGRK